ncbi:baseplate J/gp47 family protein, partial [Enterobacter hormaechei]|uniref:baseplate J/gp47 family protein n=1 Tax=Enterobacter hormaechei TaxID=158836 RepID=UPI00203A886A
YLGELVGVYRLAAQPASIPLQFSVEEELAIDVLIPAGTRVSASDSIIFSTDTDVVLKAGLPSVASDARFGTGGSGVDQQQPG